MFGGWPPPEPLPEPPPEPLLLPLEPPHPEAQVIVQQLPMLLNSVWAAADALDRQAS